MKKTSYLVYYSLSILFLSVLLLNMGCASTPAGSDEDPDVEPEQQSSQPVSLVDSDLIPLGDSPGRGAEDAWVQVVVFSDFQCPFCARLSATLDEVIEGYDEGVVRLVYKHFPLSQHRGALPAAKASEAAREQGKFWEMHDALFDKISNLGDADPEELLFELAASLDLDMERFEADYHSDRVARRVERDVELADSLDLRGAPAVFVNGGFIAGVQAPEVYRGAISDVHRILQQSVEDGEMRRENIYRQSVETLFAHTQPASRRAMSGAEEVVAVPVDGGRPETDTIDGALVHIAFFVSLAADPSLELQRQLSEMVDYGEGDVRVSYYHLPHNLEEPSLLAHRALHGADDPELVQDLLVWLSDDQNDWHQDLSRLQNFIEERDIEVADEEEMRRVLEADMEAAGVFEVYGTPTLFINGIRLVGVPEDGELAETIKEQEALASRVGQAMNISGRALYDAMVDGNRERGQEPQSAGE